MPGGKILHALDFAGKNSMNQTRPHADGNETGQHPVKLTGIRKDEERLEDEKIGGKINQGKLREKGQAVIQFGAEISAALRINGATVYEKIDG